MELEQVLQSLCCYDKKNPDNILENVDIEDISKCIIFFPLTSTCSYLLLLCTFMKNEIEQEKNGVFIFA